MASVDERLAKPPPTAVLASIEAKRQWTIGCDVRLLWLSSSYPFWGRFVSSFCVAPPLRRLSFFSLAGNLSHPLCTFARTH
mmetsp:Transcript_46337/g.99235  ORF Transcript_46337/g.99235 Transcript_46337/m.99235 type:complete len:81 (-) Transcript_46337:290-532(-)